MVENKTRKSVVKYLLSKILLIGLLVATFFIAKGLWDVYSKELQSSNNLASSESELDGLLKREAVLTERIERLDMPEGVEEEIVRKYSVAKEGEEVYVLLDSEEIEEVVPESQDNFFKRFWLYIKGVF